MVQEDLESSVHSTDIIQVKFVKRPNTSLYFVLRCSVLPECTEPPGEKMSDRNCVSPFLNVHETAKEA